MQARSKQLILLIVLTISVLTCSDVFEEDISDESIQLITPTDNSIILGNTVNFSWQQLNDVDSYRIQLFESNLAPVLDSLVEIPSFSYALQPGTYQWRVRGENFAYSSAYSVATNFSVEISEDLSNQTVVLETPSADTYSNSNSNSFIFTWQDLQAANTYNFELIKNLNNNEQTIFQEQNITENTVTLNASLFSEDAEYKWNVKGINASSETNFSERSLFLDRVTPNQPILASPDDLESLAQGIVVFNWTNSVDVGTVQSPIINTLEIATDINFNNIIATVESSNNTSEYNFTSNDTYYWRIIAIDLAGNQSNFSNIRTLTIQ